MNQHENSNEIEFEEHLELSIRPEGKFDTPISCFSSNLIDEIKINMKMAFPMMITNIFQYALNIETTAFCGRLTTIELEGVGLALSIISALGWFVCTGMVSACDTMFAQAFGSKNKKKTGLFLQRGFLLMNLVPVCLWFFHINFEPIFILLNQDPQISRVAGEFLISFTPGLTFMINYLLLARYMQDQGCVWPSVIAAVCGNIFNICCQLLFVTKLQYGFKAAAISHAFSFGVMTLIEFIYILKSKFYKETWPGFQLEAFFDWSSMLLLGLSGVGHITFEVIIWEAGVFMGGLLGKIEIATQSIMIQLMSLIYMTYYGVCIACNIRVGQCLGANRPNQAKLAYRAASVSIAIVMLIVATSTVLLRYQIPYIFTNKQEVIDMVIEILPFMYVLIYTDPISGALSATLRGCGRQFSGFLIVLFSFYILCLPISIVLAFVFNYGIRGIWIGNTVGSVTTGVLCGLILECQSWEKQATLAQNRILHSTFKSTGKETDYLLPTHDNKQKLIPSHIRTPSHPITCSTDITELPKHRVVLNKFVIWKRIIQMGCVFLFFLSGLCIHIFLPVDVYRHYNTTEIG